jgi:acyl-coenzyme A synthetase/AMP-(fatty) acid ligase
MRISTHSALPRATLELGEVDSQFGKRRELPALANDRDESTSSYLDLADAINRRYSQLRSASIGAGAVVGFPACYQMESVSLFFALAKAGAVAVPLPPGSDSRIKDLLALAGATHLFSATYELVKLQSRENDGPASLYRSLQDHERPGLVLFTSGTTQQPKAALHDLQQLCDRHRSPRPPKRVLGFMQMDHIGGVNTMLHVLTHGGMLVAPDSRSPHDVCAAIQKHRVEVLPVSPTFLNLMLISDALERYDLSSLQRITYGSEPMPASVLERLTRVLPAVEMLQTYGTTEVGILKSSSQGNTSLWMKVGGEGYETKVVQGRLWIRSETSMLGYLNAPSPFDDDGFMDTGDQVECRGEWMRVLGRTCEVINVGGQKVAPVEVESVLLEMPEVEEAAVGAIQHALMGQVVGARVRLTGDESIREFKIRMRRHCRGRLPNYAIPAKLELTQQHLVTDRLKRRR